MKCKAFILGISLVLIAAFMFSARPAYAQGDGRVDFRPGDRIAVYCNFNSIGVLGIDNSGLGFSLGNFSYGELAATMPGRIVRYTGAGIVSASVDSSGIFRVAWKYGPYDASGFGDFVKRFRCPVSVAPIYVYPYGYPASTAPNGSPPYGVAPYGTSPYNTGSNTGSNTASASASVSVSGSGSASASVSVSVGGNRSGRTYVVQRGDTLFRIARAYGVSVSALIYANGITNYNIIYPGQVLVIP